VRAVGVAQLLALLANDRLYWFSINFDRETILLPELPEDHAFTHVYHLNNARPGGDSEMAITLLC
jgi:hypothetical protein